MKICGIYKIYNILDDRVYIGSSKDIEGRLWKHKRDLELNKHHSIHLQRFVNKYTLKTIRFEIIEKCEESELLNLEKKNMIKYNSLEKGFNSFLPDRTIMTAEYKEKIRQDRLNCKYNKIINVIKNNKIIHTGNINSIKEKFNVDKSSVYKILKGIRKTHKGLSFNCYVV